MSPLSSLLIRLEKAATFHFHVHLGFNLGEFLQSLKGDITSYTSEMSVLDFMAEPDVCDECGGALDLQDPDTLSAEFEDEDGERFDLYYHLRCATPEMVSESESDEDADDD